MAVCNVKVAHIRPQYNNLKDWCANPDNVYIGRAGIVFIKNEAGNNVRYPSRDSIWANPYKITSDATRDVVLEKYEVYIRERLRTEPELVQRLLSLEGKNLGCWCTPEACHGDILLKLINEYK